MALKIKHGGFIRYNSIISSTETTNFAAGLVMTLTTDATAVIASSNTGLVALACEDRVPSTQFSPTASSLVQTPTGVRVSLLLDESVVIDDQVSGNCVWAVGESVYHDAVGKLTTGTDTDTRVMGKAMAVNAAGGSLEFMFTVQY
jgi:hypothetical protein